MTSEFSSGYESDIDNDEEFAPPDSATFGYHEVDHVKAGFQRDIEDAMDLSQRLQAQRLREKEMSKEKDGTDKGRTEEEEKEREDDKEREKERRRQLLSFVDSRKAGWEKTTWGGQNFLHVLAYSNLGRKPAASLQWLMSRVMLRMPHLIGCMDGMKRTPLTMALFCGNEAFSYAACVNLKPKTYQRFKKLLDTECAGQGSNGDVTCLHTALTCVFSNEDRRQTIVKVMCSFVPDKMFTTKDPQGRTPLHLAVEYERCCKGQVGIVEELLIWGPQALNIPIKANITLSVYQYHVYTQRIFENSRALPASEGKEGEETRATSENKERQTSTEEIGLLLKYFYLRTKNPETATHCLNIHGKPSKELWFDFGSPKRLTRADFHKNFRHLRFDTILQHAAFPQVELEDQKQIPDPRYAGRADMTFFFGWLQKQKITKIIKVVVDDLKSPSHSDEAIEESLRPFKVEILDWRRLDIDPVSLFEAGECLREITLHWSGRNSVLRAWSETKGLARIPTLEVINLVQTEGLELSERTQKNLDAFEKRLHESWPENLPKPTVNRPKIGGRRMLHRDQSVEALPDRPERSVDPHRWMQCMENFAEHFRQISALGDDNFAPGLEPVEVALIDDGADIPRSDLSDMKGEKFPGKSFCYYQEDSIERVSSYWDSSSGHGTLMARLIHKTCPSAVIHVIKLQTFSVENSDKLQINTDSAIKAIGYAAERGAHIISMPWTIKPPEGDKKKEFDDAIHNALNTKDVLMFCAASDQGKSADLTYPHGSNRTSFRIGAAKATGSIVDTVGDAHKLDFIFPGHQVVMKGSNDVFDRDLQRFEAHTGSSVANALAAGLAALVIECVRLRVLHTEETKQEDPTLAINQCDLAKIRDRKNMKNALLSIGTSRNTDNKYIEVWDKFDAAAEKLRQTEGSRIDQLEKIATLARHFLRKGLNYGE